MQSVIHDIFEWFPTLLSTRPASDKTPWLILGKGPSFDKRGQYDVSRFLTMSLNHVVREMPVTLAHMIDIDVFVSCQDCLPTQAQFVVLPWVPHEKNAPSAGKTLEHWVEDLPTLKQFAREGRLLTYNLATTPIRRGESPVVEADYFSAEAGINLLALLGVKTIRSLGIDGGAVYSSQFDDLSDVTLLNNGHQSFDKQFAGIARCILKTGVDYAPLAEPNPLRVFVGSSPSEILPTKILEYSIKKHTSLTSVVTPLFQADIDYPLPHDLENQPRTPFSFQRFLIPELCQYEGRAFYMDADMQVFKDLRQVWVKDFGEAEVLTVKAAGDTARRPQFSVMLMDCSRLRWSIRDIIAKLDAHELTYAELMYDFAMAKQVDVAIPAEWNSLEYYDRKKTGLTHYTDMPSQPWISTLNRYEKVWMADLIGAVDCGFLTRAFVDEQIANGWIRPSLALQLDAKEPDSRKMPRKLMTEADAAFVPPFEGLKYKKRLSEVVRDKLRKSILGPIKKISAAVSGV